MFNLQINAIYRYKLLTKLICNSWGGTAPLLLADLEIYFVV